MIFNQTTGGSPKVWTGTSSAGWPSFTPGFAPKYVMAFNAPTGWLFPDSYGTYFTGYAMLWTENGTDGGGGWVNWDVPNGYVAPIGCSLSENNGTYTLSGSGASSPYSPRWVILAVG